MSPPFAEQCTKIQIQNIHQISNRPICVTFSETQVFSEKNDFEKKSDFAVRNFLSRTVHVKSVFQSPQKPKIHGRRTLLSAR